MEINETYHKSTRQHRRFLLPGFYNLTEHHEVTVNYQVYFNRYFSF